MPQSMGASLHSHSTSQTTVAQILSRRIFPTQVNLPAPLETYYQRRVMTRYLGRQRVHALKYAY